MACGNLFPLYLPYLSCAGFGSISALWRVPRSAERPAYADHRPRHVATRSDNARGPEEVGGFNGNLDYSDMLKASTVLCELHLESRERMLLALSWPMFVTILLEATVKLQAELSF